jgi:hypothetical protein
VAERTEIGSVVEIILLWRTALLFVSGTKWHKALSFEAKTPNSGHLIKIVDGWYEPKLQ